MRDEAPDQPDLGVRNRWWLLSVLLFGLFSINVTITILAVSIPRIARELDSTQNVLTWVVAGPILAFGIIGPAIGKVGDLWGQRRVYLFGLAGAGVTALASALAWDAGSLILFRVLAAVGGAATGPASFAVISRVFPAHERVKALGFWSMVGAGGPVIGVVIGGPLVSSIGWRAIFLLQLPIIAVALLLAYRTIPETPRQVGRAFDWRGALLLAGTATPLLVALNQGPLLGWSHPFVLACLVLAPACMVGFARVERRVEHPLLPLRYLSERNFSGAIAVAGLANAAYMGSFVLTPLLLENVLHYSETRTGLISIARPISFSIVGASAGVLVLRIGERWAALAGGAVLAVAMVWMSGIGEGSSALYIMGGLALAGVALGVISPAMSSCVTHAVDPEDLGVAGAAQQMILQVGTSLGIQLMQTVHAVRVDAVGDAAAYRDAYLAGAVLAALALLAGLLLRRVPSQEPVRDWGAPEGAPALIAD